MSIITKLQETIARAVLPGVARSYGRKLDNAHLEINYMAESMSLLQLEMENLQYRRLSLGAGEGFTYTREHLQDIVNLALQMARKNPITVRSIKVQADYIFGQGVAFNAKHPAVQAVIDEHICYRENRNSLFSHTAMLRAEQRQQVYGSMFFVLNTNTSTGRVIVRNLPMTEVQHIICDPSDRDREWYIHHVIEQNGETKHVYHPAYGIMDIMGLPKPWEISTDYTEGIIAWSAPILHVAANKLGDEQFALPEIYPQLDWALVYKRTLEQWVSIQAAFSRMAMKLSGLKGRKQAAAAKALLATTTTLSNQQEGNPPSVAGSTALLGEGRDLEPIKTAGAATPPSDADPILNFAGCGVGLPNTFFGDAGKGNFATAKTLDRPTELKMISRQKLWKEIFTDILDYIVFCSAVYPGGALASLGAMGMLSNDLFTGEASVQVQMPMNQDEQYGEVGKPIDCCFEVFFPEVLERNVADRVRALVNALTLFGKPLMDIIPDKRLVAQWLLEAMNVPDAKTYIPGFVIMWEKNMAAKDDGKPVEPTIIPPPPPAKAAGAGAEDPSQGGAVGNNG